MDDTKKTLLSIDIDTAALTQNTANAKAAVKDLTDQLTALKAAGKDGGPLFSQLSAQLKATNDVINQSSAAFKAYVDGLTKKAQADQANVQTAQKNNLTLIAQQKQQIADSQKLDTDATKQAVDGSNQRAALLEQSNAVLHIAINAEDENTAKKQTDITKKTAAINDQFEKTRIAAHTGILKETNANRISAIKSFNEQAEKVTKSALDIELTSLQTRDKGYAASADKLAGIFSKNLEANKAAVLAKKAFAIAEIGINTEQQVSSYVSATASAVQGDMLIPIIGPTLAAIDIAGGAVEVAAAIANGVKQIANINSISVTSLARGGIFQSDGKGTYLTGPGSGTSDSINARLSNGESVINARSTAMFAPILSAINQAGGGRPFHNANGGNGYAMGGLFNGSNTLNDGSSDLANTRAMTDMVRTIAANIPRQVLVVEDVQASLQNKVMLKNMSNF